MKNLFRTSIFFLLIASLLFSACGGPEKDFSTHSSDDGYIPEAFIPGEVGVMFSYSLRDDEQYAMVTKIEQYLGDVGRINRTVSDSFDAQFAEFGLSYEADLLPALGDQFRFVFAGRPGSDAVDAFSVVTLADPNQMRALFEKMAAEGTVKLKKLSDTDAYVDESGDFYAAIYKDLLFITNDPENLVGMIEQDEETSLWNSADYQDEIEKLGSNYVFYGLMFPGLFGQDLDLAEGFSLSDIPSVVDSQSLVVRAAEGGFSFDAYVNANKDLAADAGISFDAVPKAAPYLYEEVPSDGLMAYFESYGLEQTLMQAEALGDESGSLAELSSFSQSYLGMDFEEEILSFLDRGYSIALHKNGNGVIPGISIFVDVSSDKEGAEKLLATLDGQISGLLLVLETALPGAVSKGTTMVNGNSFNILEIDLSSLPRTDDSSSPLPAAVTSSPIQLAYGLMDDRLLITTAETWSVEGETISDSALYKSLGSKIDGVDEGLVLIDAQGISSFAGTLLALREQLGLGVNVEGLDIEGALEGFMGVIVASKTKAYESHFGGFLMIAE